MSSPRYEADLTSIWFAADHSMMCEAHPGKEWPHDDCAGPGMPWVIQGRTLIKELIPSVPLSAIRALVQQWEQEMADAMLLPSPTDKMNRATAYITYQHIKQLAALCPAPPEDQP